MRTRRHVLDLAAICALLVGAGCRGHLTDSERRAASEDLAAAVEEASSALSEGGLWIQAAGKIEGLQGRLSGLDIAVVRRILANVKDPQVLIVVLLSLGRVEKAWASPLLVEYLSSSQMFVRVGAAYALAIQPKRAGETDTDALFAWHDRQRLWIAWQAGIRIPYESVMTDIGPVKDSPSRRALIGSYAGETEITVKLLDLYLLQGSAGYDDVSSHLMDRLRNDSFLLARQAAAQALSGSRSTKARQALRQAIETDPDEGVRSVAIRSLAVRASEEDLSYLEGLYPRTGDVGQKCEIIDALATGRSDHFQRFLAGLAATESEIAIMTDALRALAEMKSRYALDALVSKAPSRNVFVRVVVASCLGELGDPKARSTLNILANDAADAVREAAQASLKEIGR